MGIIIHPVERLLQSITQPARRGPRALVKAISLSGSATTCSGNRSDRLSENFGRGAGEELIVGFSFWSCGRVISDPHRSARRSYIPLASVMRLGGGLSTCSRSIVGWALADHLRTELIQDALRTALGERELEPSCLHHSDPGCQYASSRYRDLCTSHGMKISMSRRGNRYDNAVVDSFFGPLVVVDSDRRAARPTTRVPDAGTQRRAGYGT